MGAFNSIKKFTTDEGVEFFAIPQHGAFFAVQRYRSHDILLHCPMMADTQLPDANPEWGLNIGEVTNVDDDENFVKEVNMFFGTAFTLKDFPGR